jgi:hypothetical protein
MQPLRKDPILRKMNVCVHFTGIQHDQCKAGISYNAVREGKTETTPFRFACFQDEAQGLVCEQARFPTREEAEAEKRADDAAFERVMKASRAAHDDAKAKRFGKGQGGADSVPCPVCEKGRLYYRVASYNGHMHAKCETEGCVSWME